MDMRIVALTTALAAVVAAASSFGGLAVKNGDTLALIGDSIAADVRTNPDGYVNLVLKALAYEGVEVKPVVVSRKGVTLDDYRRKASEFFAKCAAPNCFVVNLAVHDDWLCAEAKRRGCPLADIDSARKVPADEKCIAREVLRALGFPADRFAAMERNCWTPVWVFCRFDLKPDTNRAEYLAKTKSILAAVRAEAGCREYRLLGDFDTDWDKPQRFGDRTLWMLEKWGSVRELQAHLQTPHMKAFGPTVRPLREASTFHVLEDVLP